jgi:hypothetical protein
MEILVSTNEELKLYRFEYLQEDLPVVEWVWLKFGEAEGYFDNHWSMITGVSFRVASQDEEDLYNEAFNDGYMLATVEENHRNDNGITFRLNSFTLTGMDTTKMFQCARCDKRKDFDDEVAVANGLYLAEAKEDILWHICFDCVMLQNEVESISIDSIEEDGYGSGTV